MRNQGGISLGELFSFLDPVQAASRQRVAEMEAQRARQQQQGEWWRNLFGRGEGGGLIPNGFLGHIQGRGLFGRPNQQGAQQQMQGAFDNATLTGPATQAPAPYVPGAVAYANSGGVPPVSPNAYRPGAVGYRPDKGPMGPVNPMGSMVPNTQQSQFHPADYWRNFYANQQAAGKAGRGGLR